MLFDTRAGPLRLRWNERGLVAIEMPELSPRQLRAELLKPGAAPPPFVRKAAQALKAHLGGTRQDLSQLPLDLSVLAPFQRAVYEAVRTLPPGRTALQFARSYGGKEIATVVASNFLCGPIEAALTNGMLAHAKRLPDHRDFDGIEIFMKGGTASSKVFSVRAGPLNAK